MNQQSSRTPGQGQQEQSANYPVYYQSQPQPAIYPIYYQGQPQPANYPAYYQGQPQPSYLQDPSGQHVVIMTPNDSNIYVDGERTAASQPWAGTSFSSKKIRHAFIRKVYLTLTVLLLVTAGFISVFLFVGAIKSWVRRNSWFYWISFGVYFATYLIIVCCDHIRRSFPVNYICLAIFNLAFSYVCAAISSYYRTEIVLIAVGITVLVCFSVSLFAIQTRIDFTLCTGLIFVLSMVVMLFGLACILVYVFIGPNYILHCVYGAVVALVFTLFLAYDTQLVIGGRKYQLSSEEYIVGALQLYMDVGTLYMIILSFFNISDN